jgi:hypothetical protein
MKASLTRVFGNKTAVSQDERRFGPALAQSPKHMRIRRHGATGHEEK